ncbi:hypothetical protein CSPX01_05159 [Colletotrichum filicis]|nr:hypothetical protein CSPX01_05159 [Colletotrichum filicis]
MEDGEGMQALFSRLLGLALLHRQVRTGREMYLCTHLECGGNEGTAPGSYHPIDPSPVLGRVSYRAFLAFSPCRFLPIAHVPSALPSKFSPVINHPFPSSCLLLTTFPPFHFLFLFVTFTFAKYPTQLNKPQPTRLQSPSPLPSSSLLSSISPHTRFVTTTRRSLESSISRADRHRQASRTRRSLPDYRHSLVPPRPWPTDVQSTKDPDQSPLKRRFPGPVLRIRESRFLQIPTLHPPKPEPTERW